MPNPKLIRLNAGADETVAERLEEMATAAREATGEAKPVGYLALIVRADNGVTLSWDGNELSILGALVYARDRVCTRWYDEKED